MNIHVLRVGPFQTNCYIIATALKNAVVIDPGAEPDTILQCLQREHLTAKQLIFTHCHFDHIGAAPELQKATGAVTVVPQDDLDIFLDPALGDPNLFSDVSAYQARKPDRLYQDGDILLLEEIQLTALHTPGHTKGSSVLMGDGYLLTGDTLFAGSCGRTDLYGGSAKAMRQSMQKLQEIEGEYQILPGHGEQTSLSYEKRTNPYLGSGHDIIF